MKSYILKTRPVRMCIICKGRFLKTELKRFKVVGNELIKEPKNGRSFYICKTCILNSNSKKFKNIFSNYTNIKNFGDLS